VTVLENGALGVRNAAAAARGVRVCVGTVRFAMPSVIGRLAAHPADQSTVLLGVAGRPLSVRLARGGGRVCASSTTVCVPSARNALKCGAFRIHKQRQRVPKMRAQRLSPPLRSMFSVSLHTAIYYCHCFVRISHGAHIIYATRRGGAYIVGISTMNILFIFKCLNQGEPCVAATYYCHVFFATIKYSGVVRVGIYYIVMKY